MGEITRRAAHTAGRLICADWRLLHYATRFCQGPQLALRGAQRRFPHLAMHRPRTRVHQTCTLNTGQPSRTRDEEGAGGGEEPTLGVYDRSAVGAVGPEGATYAEAVGAVDPHAVPLMPHEDANASVPTPRVLRRELVASACPPVSR